MRRGLPRGAASRQATSDHPAARQEETEAHYLRMWRLRQMSHADLRVLLAGDPARAAPWIESAARYGVAEAQVRLGQMRLDGLGAPADPEAALNWFLRAAKKGSPEAMNMAGRCYENGWGTPEDLSAAAERYKCSGEAGHDWGQYNYANLLLDGRGVAQDYAEAVVWYLHASSQGHTRAMNVLARCYEEGWGVARDPKEAYDWYARSARGGYFRAQYNYATLLMLTGRIDEALDWFEQSLSGAMPKSLGVMIDGLIGHGDLRLAALAGQYAPGASANIAAP